MHSIEQEQNSTGTSSRKSFRFSSFLKLFYVRKPTSSDSMPNVMTGQWESIFSGMSISSSAIHSSNLYFQVFFVMSNQIFSVCPSHHLQYIHYFHVFVIFSRFFLFFSQIFSYFRSMSFSSPVSATLEFWNKVWQKDKQGGFAFLQCFLL